MVQVINPIPVVPERNLSADGEEITKEVIIVSPVTTTTENCDSKDVDIIVSPTETVVVSCGNTTDPSVVGTEVVTPNDCSENDPSIIGPVIPVIDPITDVVIIGPDSPFIIDIYTCKLLLETGGDIDGEVEGFFLLEQCT